jgi:hypothetical protein
MYLFARATLKPGYRGALGAIIAGIAYLYFPFRVSETYQRGAIGEAVFCAIAPLFLLTSYNLLMKGVTLKRWLAATTVFGVGLLTYHLQIVLIAIFGGGWLVFMLVARVYERRHLPKDSNLIVSNSWQLKQVFWLGTAIVFGLAMGAIFWLPAITEKDYTMIPYFNQFLDRNFAYSTQNLTLFPPISVVSYNTNWIGLNHIILGLTVGYVLLRRHRMLAAGQGLRKAQTFYFMMAIALILFIQIPDFYDTFLVINRYIPLEFPSRLLVFAGVANSWLVGLLPKVISRKWFLPGTLLALGWVITCGITNVQIYQFPAVFDDHIPYEVLSKDVNRADVSYLPDTLNTGWEEVHGPNAPINLAADDKIQDFIQSGEPNLPAVTEMQVEKGLASYNIKVTVDKATSVILPPFYYPSWVVKVVVDGKEVKTLPTYPSDRISLLSVDLPAAGVYQLQLRYEDTPAAAIGNCASLISWSIWAILIIVLNILSFKNRLRVKKS